MLHICVPRTGDTALALRFSLNSRARRPCTRIKTPKSVAGSLILWAIAIRSLFLSVENAPRVLNPISIRAGAYGPRPDISSHCLTPSSPGGRPLVLKLCLDDVDDEDPTDEGGASGPFLAAPAVLPRLRLLSLLPRREGNKDAAADVDCPRLSGLGSGAAGVGLVGGAAGRVVGRAGGRGG